MFSEELAGLDPFVPVPSFACIELIRPWAARVTEGVGDARRLDNSLVV